MEIIKLNASYLSTSKALRRRKVNQHHQQIFTKHPTSLILVLQLMWLRRSKQKARKSHWTVDCSILVTCHIFFLRQCFLTAQAAYCPRSAWLHISHAVNWAWWQHHSGSSDFTQKSTIWPRTVPSKYLFVWQNLLLHLP